jgi:hypothetical protein
MRKLYLLLAIMLLSSSAFAQGPQPQPVQHGTAAPTNPCFVARVYNRDSNGHIYGCASGTWTDNFSSATPGGSNTQMQFNDSGGFGGDAGFTYNKTTDTATLGALSLTNPLTVGNGGTGQTTYTNGQLLIGNTTGNTLTKATLTAGSNVTVTNGGGSITLASTAWALQGWEDTGAVRTVAAASTQYNCMLGCISVTFNATESNRINTTPGPGTVSNLVIRTGGTQPNDGSLTCTARNTTTTTDSALSIVIAANTAAGTFSDTTHSMSLATLDTFVLKCVNTSPGTASAGLVEVRFRFTPQ